MNHPPPSLAFEVVPTTSVRAGQTINARLVRAKVPGGWLVGPQDLASTTFVPDAEHAWGAPAAATPAGAALELAAPAPLEPASRTTPVKIAKPAPPTPPDAAE